MDEQKRQESQESAPAAEGAGGERSGGGRRPTARAFPARRAAADGAEPVLANACRLYQHAISLDSMGSSFKDSWSRALGTRTVTLPVPLAPNRCLTIDALGRATYWPGGMAEGRAFEVEGGALILPPGETPIEITLDPAEGFAGDLSVRVCRTWALGE